MSEDGWRLLLFLLEEKVSDVTLELVEELVKIVSRLGEVQLLVVYHDATGDSPRSLVIVITLTSDSHAPNLRDCVLEQARLFIQMECA